MKIANLKTLKNFLSTILTVLTMGVLFTVIFIEGGWVTPGGQFFKELAIVICLTLSMKLWWYDWAEDKRLSEQDIETQRTDYFKMVDEHIPDSNELEDFLVVLNQENREHYISNKMGCRCVKNLSKKTFWLCLFHPSFRKLTEEQIGLIRYENLYYKIQRKADKLRKVKSSEIIALSSTELLYDAKNYSKKHKRLYQTLTTIASIIFTTMFASMALEQFMLNWINVFRYVCYLCSMAFSIATTIVTAYRQSGNDMKDYLSRLMFIVDKFITYKEEKVNGDKH